MSDYRIPARMLPGLRRYIDHGIPPGSFLTAVLENDLRGACECADDENRWLIWSYVVYLYNEAPSQCWGSPIKVEAWMAEKAEANARSAA